MEEPRADWLMMGEPIVERSPSSPSRHLSVHLLPAPTPLTVKLVSIAC